MRKMVVDNYIVCYIVDPGIVTVTDVLYGAANVHSWVKGVISREGSRYR